MRIDPIGPSPNNVGPMAEKTSAELSGFASPIPVVADAGEGHGGDGHDRVGGQQENRADDGRAPRRLVRVLRLLIHRDRTVPAPVDEDRRQHCRGNRLAKVERERIEPVPADGIREYGSAVPEYTLTSAKTAKKIRMMTSKREQHILHAGRELDAPVADPGHHRDPRQACNRRRNDVVRQLRDSRQARIRPQK